VGKYKETEKGNVPRRDQWLGIFGIYVKYQGGNPVFDEMKSCGGSRFGLIEVCKILEELNLILTDSV